MSKTIRKHMPTIYIHPILLIFIIISFLTGTFTELVIILFIVLIHELGHYMVAHAFKWRIKHIMLWVFGGVMHTDEHGNKSIFEETCVTIAGPLQHIFIYVVAYILSVGNFVPEHISELLYFYNTVILLFNLLPIWPLDGGKLLFLVLCILFPYRHAYHMTIISSIIACLTLIILQLFLLPFTLSAFLITLFILLENWNEWKHRFYVFIRFLLKRYEGDADIRKIHALTVPHHYDLIDIFSLFKQTKKHTIYILYPNGTRKQIDENDCLQYYFYEKKSKQMIGDIVSNHV